MRRTRRGAAAAATRAKKKMTRRAAATRVWSKRAMLQRKKTRRAMTRLRSTNMRPSRKTGRRRLVLRRMRTKRMRRNAPRPRRTQRKWTRRRRRPPRPPGSKPRAGQRTTPRPPRALAQSCGTSAVARASRGRRAARRAWCARTNLWPSCPPTASAAKRGKRRTMSWSTRCPRHPRQIARRCGSSAEVRATRARLAVRWGQPARRIHRLDTHLFTSASNPPTRRTRPCLQQARTPIAQSCGTSAAVMTTMAPHAAEARASARPIPWRT
mmetsp:Transcript_7534/g.19089  ORF Transcript_7534/g.19089 Transcript_7534/m.19089 type:complete len:268 (+) Transcript_7534:418-1221(+)